MLAKISTDKRVEIGLYAHFGRRIYQRGQRIDIGTLSLQNSYGKVVKRHCKTISAPVMIPERICGSTTFLIAYIGVAPRSSAAS